MIIAPFDFTIIRMGARMIVRIRVMVRTILYHTEHAEIRFAKLQFRTFFADMWCIA